MAFWSGERLAVELPNLITPYQPKHLDCASYRLSVGEQAFVTSDKLSSDVPEAELITFLSAPPKNLLRISPGQFAFLLTDEVVEVPPTALALISMRAKYKFKGLINVSGFHVDPGWKGKLLFSVYNAGPAPILIEKGEALFLIVYSDLDRTSAKPHLYNGDAQGQASIKTELISGLNSQVFSPQILQQKLDASYEKMSRVDRNTSIAFAIASALLAITSILVATVALLPSWVGVVTARTLDAAGYEIRQKPDPKDASHFQTEVAKAAKSANSEPSEPQNTDSAKAKAAKAPMAEPVNTR
jgi:dCTP deaminase